MITHVLLVLVLGLTWDNISSCVHWMAPFVRTVNEYGQPKLKDFKKVAPEDQHNIQTHVDYLSMLVSIVFLKFCFSLQSQVRTYEHGCFVCF